MLKAKSLEGRLADTKTDFFYKEIAEPFLNELEGEISFTYLDIRNYEKIIKNNNKSDDNKLVALFKLFSPENLLKLPFANDSNSLDKSFYAELLHIIGLQETKEGSKKLIGRKAGKERNAGSLIENTITILNYEDCLSQIKASDYGANKEEQLYNVALELVITWINRVLFLKLLEGQLVKYHSGDTSFKFLNIDRIADYDALNKLFFQVLAIKESERNDLVKQKFGNIPYLNSSLFEPNDLEHKTVRISNLEDEYSLPVLHSTVLKNKAGKRQSGELNTLEYLFAFLDSYDFASEGAEEIQEENKTLINASVLGLIFEKINGYKDGSFFTPGFITMYMCRETIRRAVVQKFNEAKNWDCKTISDLYDKIEDRQEANNIINGLKICDPAVGSGHFLVSALNEIIAIKNDLRILSDREGKRLKEYHVEVVNDELVITDEDGELFEYKPKNKESQRIQETLFHEKQALIENCLFGVDINPNSVKICRLRLWIELLKNAYYKSSPPFQGGVPEGGGGSLNNLPHLKTFRKQLRNNLTPAEATLWKILQGKKLDGRKFRRQHSIGNYILDFYCPSEKLAIELDGEVHSNVSAQQYDYERDLFLQYYGIKVLRFENKLVFEQQEMVLQAIKNEFGKQPPRPADTPPLKGGEQRELETLPNIDINIKCGNSLISRYALDADIKKALKKSKWSIDSYRVAVMTYRNAQSKEEKRNMEKLIDEIKNDFESEIAANDKRLVKLNKLKGELFAQTNQQQLFDQSKTEKANWDKKVKKLTSDITKLETEIAEIRTNKIYENAFEWRFEFPEVLNDDGEFVGFDVVIGNPPYISISKTKEESKFYENADYLTYLKGTDIYCLFYEKGINILKSKGFLTYITSNSWLRAIYGETLKQFFINYAAPIQLLNIEDIQVFEEATVESNIITVQKGNDRKVFEAVNLSNDFELSDSLSDYFIKHKFDFHIKNASEWFIGDIKIGKLKSKIENGSTLLKDFNIRINFGIKTGYNEAFIINKTKRDELIQLDYKNEKLIKPILRGRDLKKYSYQFNEQWVICTFPSLKINIEEYPVILDYFHKIGKSRLKQSGEKGSRKKTNNKWYETQDSIAYWQDFENHKIIWGEISDKPKFAYDQQKHYAEATTFLMTGEKLKFLLAILNSKVSEWYFNLIGTTTGMGTNRWKKYKIELLPVKKPTHVQELKFEELVTEIIHHKENNIIDTSKIEEEIDQLVYKLYGLTEEEIKIVENSVK